MTPRRTWAPYRDPAAHLPLAQRAAVHWRANVRMLRSAGDVLAFVMISIAPVPLGWAAGFGAIAAANAVDPQLRAVVGWTAAVAGFVVYALVQHVAFMRAMHRHYDPFVMAELAARGQAVCPACLHRLGPRPPVTCPECGSATLRGG